MPPKVAIVGRPNVGKSSLFNMLCGKRVSIVDAMPGVTRDRLTALVDLSGARPTVISDDDQLEPLESEDDIPNPDAEPDGQDGEPRRLIELTDTGGHGIEDAQQLTAEVERQIAMALAEADLVLFVVDAQGGILPLDEQVARLLRHGGRHTPVLLVANKVDGESLENLAFEAMTLGFGEPIPVSATTRYQQRLLVEAMVEAIDWDAAAARGADDTDAAAVGVKLAIVGKRNAGKSTLVNALAGDERVIVSELEGTTRDSVDVRFEMEGHVFTAIDTAGVRKRKSMQEDVEYYSYHRALRSIRRADVVLMLIDATVPVSQVDKQLTRELLRHHKPTVIVINKWDLVEEKLTTEDYLDYLDEAVAGLTFAPLVFISAKSGEGLREVVGMAMNLHEQAGHRVTTGELNRIVERIVTEHAPPSKLGKRLKVYYVSQVGTRPPRIGLWVNNPDLFTATYQRYMLNRFRELLPFSEVPIELVIRPRGGRE